MTTHERLATKKRIFHVQMTLYTVNTVYDGFISRFIESDKQTAEEVKQEILEYQKKRHITVKSIHITGPMISKKEQST